MSHEILSDSLGLTGKVAVVTGSGRGLGLAYATALARAGASVVVNDLDAEVAAQAAKLLTEAGGRAVAEAVAVGSSEAAQALVDRAVAEFGRLDVMVTNAGILRDKVLWKMTDEDFDAVVTTHLRGTFTCARAAAIRMREQGEGGSLIMVGSPAGQRGNFGQTNYSAAKAGIAAMVRTWSMELARNGISVNAIVPVAATAMTETIPAFAPYIEAMKQGGPLPDFLRKGEGFGTAEDCAALVPFLASDAARTITGQCIGIGGDKLALWSHPQETAVAYADGGWTPQSIAASWATSVGRELQTVGIPAPVVAEGSAK
jgi:NAD(P)-dependent dehydrogenase (short-subunit alcohol dehydrogenase family)